MQLNARVRPQLKKLVERLATECNFTKEELVEVAFASLVGTRDNIIDAKRMMAQMKAKELELSFKCADRHAGQPEAVVGI